MIKDKGYLNENQRCDLINFDPLVNFKIQWENSEKKRKASNG